MPSVYFYPAPPFRGEVNLIIVKIIVAVNQYRGIEIRDELLQVALRKIGEVRTSSYSCFFIELFELSK